MQIVSLPRQLVAFAGIGAVQWLLDSAVMMTLSHAGLAVLWATLIGRVCGACLGYWLNGRYTFAGTRTAVHRRSLQRFIGFWLLSSVASALVLAWIDASAGLHMSWLLKPVVDVVAAAIGFLVSRHWIYRPQAPH